MQEVIILRGLPASGKSTWAAQQIVKGNYKRVNKDLLRKMFDISAFSKENELFVEKIRDILILEILRNGNNVIVDDTNINPKHINNITKLVKQYNAQIIIKDFVAELSELIKRDSDREFPVGSKVILDMYRQWKKCIGEYPTSEVTTVKYPWLDLIKKTEKLPKAYIFDIDGTISLLNGRNPYDASLSDKDVNNVPVTTLLKKIAKDTEIIILSGRSEEYKKSTETFLKKHHIIGALHMRKAGDNRPDAVIKKELYIQHIKGQFQILGVFDDRPVVRRMWINEGLFVFSCYQDINFSEF